MPEDPSLTDLRASVTQAADVANGLWLSYLFTLFYLLLAVAGVTQTDLLLQNGIELPFLSGIKLPLLGFFWLGPVILLVAHAYVLHHLSLLADKARLLDTRLSEDERNLLTINLFVQMLIGRQDGKFRATHLLAALVAWLTLVAGPVMVLVFFELQFLPYHDEATTWWARITVLLDLGLIWWLWPRVASRGELNWRPKGLSRACRWTTAGLGVAACYLVLLVATFAGERLEAALPPIPLHQTLVGGDLDANSFLSRSLWSNRLIVPGVVIFKREQYDTPAKLAAAPSPKSMRNRHLEQAILTEAQLSHVDFTGAHLEGASLVRAHAEGAWFDHADLAGAQLDDSEMEGASFFNAHMVGATLSGIFLQGAGLAGADLQAGWLVNAQLDGASLAGADLRWATLDHARLFGTSMSGAFLQHASLADATMDGASLDKASVFKTDSHGATAKQGLYRENVEPVRDDVACVLPPDGACDPADTQAHIHELIDRYVPDNASRAAMIERLFGKDPLEQFPASGTASATLRPLPRDDEISLAALWAQIACRGKAAPFVITFLIQTYDGDGWTRPRFKPGTTQLIADLRASECAAKGALPDASQMLLLDLDKDRPDPPAASPVVAHPAASPDETRQSASGIGNAPSRTDR